MSYPLESRDNPRQFLCGDSHSDCRDSANSDDDDYYHNKYHFVLLSVVTEVVSEVVNEVVSEVVNEVVSEVVSEAFFFYSSSLIFFCFDLSIVILLLWFSWMFLMFFSAHFSPFSIFIIIEKYNQQSQSIAIGCDVGHFWKSRFVIHRHWMWSRSFLKIKVCDPSPLDVEQVIFENQGLQSITIGCGAGS